MSHPVDWKDWFYSEPECVKLHSQPGECIPEGGIVAILPFLLSVVGIVGIIWYISIKVPYWFGEEV